MNLEEKMERLVETGDYEAAKAVADLSLTLNRDKREDAELELKKKDSKRGARNFFITTGVMALLAIISLWFETSGHIFTTKVSNALFGKVKDKA